MTKNTITCTEMRDRLLTKLEKEFDLLVFIGRFSPVHNEHKRIIDLAIKKSRHVLVLIGSAGSPRTIRNPFTYQERRSMIEANFVHPFYGVGSEAYALPEHHTPVLTIKPLFDKTYNDSAWIKQVQTLVTSVAMDIANPGMANQIFKPNGTKDLKIGLIGASKDQATSYYLKMFPQWASVDAGVETQMHSTDVRNEYFEHQLVGSDAALPGNVINFMNEFSLTTYFNTLRDEFEFVEKYKQQWQAAPYPVKHMTIDCLVEQSGHVLLVKRRSEPGRGLWALPGGHLEISETMLDGAIRELREETKIKVPDPVLRGNIVANRMFDDPHRSNIGRVITQAYHIKLPDAVELPKVKGSDDAVKAQWVPIADLHENELFDDHYFIASWFLGI